MEVQRRHLGQLQRRIERSIERTVAAAELVVIDAIAADGELDEECEDYATAYGGSYSSEAG